jgi:hypothetical protein
MLNSSISSSKNELGEPLFLTARRKQGVGMKIGFVSMPLSGHLNPMTALARRVKSRGNEVVFFGVPDVEPFARAAGLDFVPYGEAKYPVVQRWKSP